MLMTRSIFPSAKQSTKQAFSLTADAFAAKLFLTRTRCNGSRNVLEREHKARFHRLMIPYGIIISTAYLG